VAKSTGAGCGLWLLFTLATVVLAAGAGPEAVQPIFDGPDAYSVTPDPGGWHVLWNVAWTEASLFHDALLPGQTYTVVVSQARDMARNALTPVQWTFATMPVEEHHHVYLPLVVKGE
jgi:hypothetical protein